MSEFVHGYLGTPEGFEGVAPLKAAVSQKILQALHVLEFSPEHLKSFIRGKTHIMAFLSEPFISCIVSEIQAVLGTAGEHPVGLLRAHGHEVVDKYADVGLGPLEHQRLLSLDLLTCIDSGHQALAGGLLIAAGSVGLAGNEEILHYLGFQRALELDRIQIGILDGIGGSHDDCILKTFDGVDEILLHILRKRR